MKGEALKGHLEMLLLATLRSGPAHGYGIINDLKQRSEGAFDLQEGTIYPALHRLERSGLVESAWSVENGRRRRVYMLKPKGGRTLREKTAEWQSFSRATTRTLGTAA